MLNMEIKSSTHQCWQMLTIYEPWAFSHPMEKAGFLRTLASKWNDGLSSNPLKTKVESEVADHSGTEVQDMTKFNSFLCNIPWSSGTDFSRTPPDYFISKKRSLDYANWLNGLWILQWRSVLLWNLFFCISAGRLLNMYWIFNSAVKV